MAKDTVSQPDMGQPRAEDYSGSSIEKAALLNVAPEDLPADMPLELRRNIIRNANEVYHLGTKNNAEYATVFDAQTGEAGSEHRLITQGEYGAVNIKDAILTAQTPVGIAHNHTNGTIPSIDDIDILTANEMVESVFTSSDGRLFRIEKIAGMEYNNTKDMIWKEIDALMRKNASISHAMANSPTGAFEEVAAIFGKYGVKIERW